MQLEPTYDRKLADHWQDLMARWEADNSAMAELMQSLEREPDAERKASLRIELGEREDSLVALCAEIESLIKQAAGRRGSGDGSFTMATVYTAGTFRDRSPSARIRSRRSS